MRKKLKIQYRINEKYLPYGVSSLDGARGLHPIISNYRLSSFSLFSSLSQINKINK